MTPPSTPPLSWVATSTPYPWPWDGDLDPARVALVVTGWDTGWRAAVAGPDGSPGWARLETVVERIGRLAAVVGRTMTVSHPPAHRRQGGPIPPETPGVVPLSPFGTDHVQAGGIDGFHASPLADLVGRTGIDRLLVVGLGLETTVHSTMRSANDRGLECLLVVDACAPLDEEMVAPAVSMIEMSGGIFGAVATTDAVLSALSDPPADPPAGSPAGSLSDS